MESNVNSKELLVEPSCTTVFECESLSIMSVLYSIVKSIDTDVLPLSSMDDEVNAPRMDSLSPLTIPMTTAKDSNENIHSSGITITEESLLSSSCEDAKIRYICRKILLSNSVIMALTDINTLTTHSGGGNRKVAIRSLLDEGLLLEDFYLARRNATTTNTATLKCYAKAFPMNNSITAKTKFIDSLSKYNVRWSEYILSFNHGQIIEIDSMSLSEKAKELFQANDYYKQYVRYDVHQILLPLQEHKTNLSSRTTDTFHTVAKKSTKKRRLSVTTDETNAVGDINLSKKPRPFLAVVHIMDWDKQLSVNVTDIENVYILLIRRMTIKEISILSTLDDILRSELPQKQSHLRRILSSSENTNYTERDVSFMLSMLNDIPQSKFVSSAAIKENEIIYFGGSAAFHFNLFTSFTSNLIFCHSPFNGFTNAYNRTIELIQKHDSNQQISVKDRRLDPKLFQNTWLMFELCRFQFMVTDECFCEIPSCYEGQSRNVFLSVNNERLYSLFVSFWTHHETIPFKKCKSENCLKVFLTDGHQKPDRKVCSFDNVCDITIPELGPILIGCPHTPIRENGSGDKFYCDQHQPELLQELQQQQYTIKKEALSKTQIDNEIIEKSYNPCNVYRDEMQETKRTSFGFLATFLSCGVIVGFDESYRAEGMRRVIRHLICILGRGKLPPAMLYDTACTLRLFIDKWFNTEYLSNTENAEFLKTMSLAIDRFHQPNHTRKMCRNEMNCDHQTHNGLFKNVDTQICERMFSYFTNFKHAFRSYNFPKSATFYLILFHLKNCDTVGINPNHQRLGMLVIPNKYRVTR
ncbi:unnamed protein product [Didymodactylos carnosus]|uniref:Transposase n=1 Tax=Didymodactylos carnosus TaxID=1234261 RepID=A0A815DFD3_9BILA|nr:unnamed protein product [Didymodactylos carnosus]CAF4111861.1 unnamed protein product [Didymodactylos carnosus]